SCVLGDFGGLLRTAGYDDFFGAGRQHGSHEQIAAIGVLVLKIVEQRVEGDSVVLEAFRQANGFFGAGVDGAARVLKDALAHGVVGGFLVFGVYRRVDVEAARIDVVLVHAIKQAASQFGNVFAMNVVAAGGRA